MAEALEVEIAALRARLGASSDSDLASLLGIGRSAVSQWRKRGRIPRSALLKAERLLSTRLVERRYHQEATRLPESVAQFSRALAILFIARYAARDGRVDPTALLRWAASLDELTVAASVRLRTVAATTGEEMSEVYAKELTSPFLIQDMLETAMTMSPPPLPQSE